MHRDETVLAVGLAEAAEGWVVTSNRRDAGFAAGAAKPKGRPSQDHPRCCPRSVLAAGSPYEPHGEGMKRQPNRSRGKATKRRRPVRPSKDKFVPPRTVEEFFAMSTHDQALWKNVTQAVTEVRAGVSLRRASRKFGVWSPSRFPRCASTNVQSGNSALRPGEEKAHACDNAC